MSRWTPPFVAMLVVTLILLGVRGAAPARAATLPAGWNLVAGADGATLTGATGQIYSLQPGDANYEVFAADRPLKAGWGYWAYFPTGGSVSSPGSRSGYSVALTSGAWAMIGNPTSDCSVSVSGADTVLTYSPGAGYQETTTLSMGQGAWAIGSGTVTLTPGSCVAQPATPSPTATPTPAATPAPAATPGGPDLNSISGLQAVALTQSDLPGYTNGTGQSSSVRLSSRGGAIAYAAVWVDPNARSPRLFVINALATYPTPARAHDAYLSQTADAVAPYPKETNIASLGSKSLGDEDEGAYYLYTDSHGAQLDNYIETFRLGLTVVQVITVDFAPTGSDFNAVSYAAIILRRMQGH